MEFNAPGRKVNFGTISGTILRQFQGQFWVNYFVLTSFYNLMLQGIKTILGQFQGDF